MSVVPGFLTLGGPWLAVGSLLAGLGYALAAARPVAAWVAPALLLGWIGQAVALLVHALGLGLVEPGTRFGFAPALSMTVWLVIGVYAVESRLLPVPALRRGLALLGLTAIGLAWIFPGELRMHPHSPYAPLHWVTGIASYVLFATAVLHAALLRRAERAMRLHRGAGLPPGLPLLRLEKLTFHFVAAGFGMLSLTLLLGAWFAAPWRWDHKTLFALLSWGVFAALLLGRHRLGWRGRLAARWIHVGAVLLLLSYAGSRFVAEVLLQRLPAA